MERYALKEDAILVIRKPDEFDVQKVGEVLTIIAERDGSIETQTVVNEAKNKKSPLHKHFEWDDEVAGNNWRKQQARSIVHSIRLIDTDTDEETPAFLSVRTDKTRYHSISAVKSSSDLQLAVLRRAEKDLAAWTSRYHELSDICEVVHGLREEMRDKIDKLAREERPSA